MLKSKMITISAVVAMFLLFRNILNKRKNDIKYVKTALTGRYSPMVVGIAHAIYVLESAKFTSNIYKHTYGAGAIAITNDYPYGFRRAFFRGVKTKGLYRSSNGYNYIKFATLLDGMTFLCNYLTVNGLEKNEVFERVNKWSGGVNGYLERIIFLYNKLKNK